MISLAEIPKKILVAKKRLLQMHFESGVGHIGGNLSCFELMMVIHHRVMKKEDAFVLSKGHAAGALYVTLHSLGRLSSKDLNTFHQENTLLAGHPPARGLPGVLFGTGSLGHGLPLATGVALAKRWTRLIRGSLELVDHPDQHGACFRLTLPTSAC